MNEIKTLLERPLDRDVERMRKQLTEIECKGAIATTEYHVAHEHLLNMRGVVYDPSKKTELERKIAMERQLKGEIRKVEEWADIKRLISERLELGKAMLGSL